MLACAAAAPETFHLGVDAALPGLAEAARAVDRRKLDNAAFVRGALDELPGALHGMADAVTVFFPWGTLLAAALGADRVGLARIRALATDGAALRVITGFDPRRDGRELARLGLGDGVARPDEAGFAAAGWRLLRVAALPREAAGRLPSTWARRLAVSADRSFAQIEAVAV